MRRKAGSGRRLQRRPVEDEGEFSQSQFELEIETEQDERPSTWVKLPSSDHRSPVMYCRFVTCGQTFSTHYTFRLHVLQRHYPETTDDASGNCCVDGCQFSYNDVPTYRRHLNFHMYHAGLQYNGAETLLANKRRCSHRVDNANDIFYHGGILQCSWDKCGHTFDDVADFFQHVNSHGKALEQSDRKAHQQKFSCLWTNCKYETKRKYEVTNHLRHHSGEKMVSCPCCGAFFSNKTKLIDHCIRQTGLESSRLKCMLCNKVFPSERLLREHGRRHINNYKCSFCELTMPSPYNLRKHILHRHSDVADHVCVTCGKGYKSAMDLERHFAKHGDAVEHECDHCGKKFKWPQSLRAHQRMHCQVDESPYLCHLCPNKYRLGASLSQHFVKVHNIVLPPGHSRFTYKKCTDGYFRVMTERYETAKMQEAPQQ